MFTLYMHKRKLLGYLMRKDYDPSKTYEYEGEVVPALVKEDSGPGAVVSQKAKRKDKDKDKDKDDEAEDKEKKAEEFKRRVIDEKVETRYVLMDCLHSDYHRLVQVITAPYDMWNAIVDHFGSRDPTDYASVYSAVFRARLEDDDNPEMFVRNMDAKILDFEQVVGVELGDKFRSFIFQHSLPKE